MKLVAAQPSSEPIPGPIRVALDAIDQDRLRADVARIAIPRPSGSAGNVAVREFLLDRFRDSRAAGAGVALDDAGNIVVGDPRRARALIGAHYDSAPDSPGADDNA